MTKWFNINKVFKIGLLALILTVVVVSNSFASPGDRMVFSAAVNTVYNSAPPPTPPSTDECTDITDLRARYGAGCWSCLVFEKLTSAFLHAAKKGLPITAKAGATLLWLGSAIWFVFWALKNVSSFTQVQIGNILNDLIKFLFKIAIAYWFIVYGTAAINKYITTPILSVGAIIGQQFWDDEVDDYMEDYIPSDEIITNEEMQVLDEALRAANSAETPKTQATGAETNDDEEVEEEELPEVVEPDEYEERVQLLQKAFIAVLLEQHGEIKASCTNPARMSGGGCHSSCASQNSCNLSGSKGPADNGHRDYVKSLFVRGGSSPMVDHYCIVSITAALEETNRRVGGDITNFQTGVINCRLSMSAASKYKGGALIGNASSIVNLSKAMNYSNVGDIVFLGSGKVVAGGGASGFHATTHLGGKRLISFNYDKYYEPSYFNTPKKGVIVRTSEIFRERLKKNPNVQINEQKLRALAEKSGIQGSLVNYKGGSFAGISVDGDASLIPIIPEVKYTGPTEIMPKSVMNSMLGAMKAITNTVAENMVLGDAIMCYAGLKNGGGWYVDVWFTDFTITNFFMWLQGAVIWSLGFMLLMAVGYYFIDISFKIGFAILALPLVMGLWPFGIAQDKIFVVISIIAKGAACFAFMAVSTAFGMGLVSESLGGLDELYDNIDSLDIGGDRDNSLDAKRKEVADKLQLFSITFMMVLFSLMYFYKLVQNTCSDLVNKFFPDKAFGDSNPMHSGATMATSFAARPLKNAASLVGDIAAHQVGKAAQGALKGTLNTATGALRATGHAIAHPMRAGRAIGGKGKQALKATGRGLKAAGHAIANPKETAKKAANATKEGIKSGAKAVGGAIIHPLKTIGNAIMGKKRW